MTIWAFSCSRYGTGHLADLERGRGMVYAEKLLISRQDQLSPMHTHIIKSEDIINRGGATLIIELFGSDADGSCSSDKGGMVLCDGSGTPLWAGREAGSGSGRKCHAEPGRLACLLGRGRRCADWRGLNRQ